MNHKNLLGFFAKYPEQGKVKTRLAKDIGPENTVSFYRRMVEHVLKRTASTDSAYDRIVFYTPDTMGKQFADWLKGERLLPQRGIDIGERMHKALQEMFDIGADKAIVIGGDIPDLDREIIGAAFQQLDSADIVIGPAMDGGYYLIGMNSPHRGVFQNITWSTGKVLDETLLLIRKMGLTHRTVTPLFDVDGYEDFLRVKEMLNDTNPEL